MELENVQTVEENVDREYGVEEAVPKKARHIGFIDMMLSWGGANMQPSAWTMGGSLICVGLIGGFAVVLSSTLLAYLTLGAIGYMAYKIGTTTMGLTRFSLGVNGSKIVTVANIINLCGWTAVSNFMAAITFSYIFQMFFGWPAYGEPGSAGPMILGCVLNGVLSFLAVYIGGSKSVKIFERIMMVVLLILSIVVSIVVIREVSWAQITAWQLPEGAAIPFGTGFDTMLTFSMVFTTVVGEFTRYTKNKASAAVAPGVGGFTAVVWFSAIGMLGIVTAAIRTGTFDLNNANPSSMIMGLGLGLIALIVVLFSTVTTNMIDLYAGSLNIMNLFPKVKFRTSALVTGFITVVVSWVPVFVGTFLGAFYSFMDVLGAIFPPMLMVMIVDFFVIRRQKYDMADISKVNGKYWYKGGFNLYAIVSWLLGTALFIVLRSISFGASTIGCVVPSCIFTCIVYFIASKIAISKNAYADIKNGQVEEPVEEPPV